MEQFDALNLPENKRRYILETLNPLLEHMVAETIAVQPEDPVPFLLDWLEVKRVEREESKLTVAERDNIIAENQKLQEDVQQMAGRLTKTASLNHSSKVEHEEEEDEDDEDEEPPPDFFKEVTPGKARASVSAEAYGEWNTRKNFVPPVIAKSKDQKDRLRSCLTKSFLFANLESYDLEICIGAMKEVPAAPGQRMINQGDNGDFLFVIESGQLNCVISLKDGSSKTVKTVSAGDVFGELSLLYNCPRAASVDAVDNCVLWQLDRDTFNAIVKEAAQKKRVRYDKFLAQVPLLHEMDSYERSQLADALKPEAFDPGAIVFNQGDPGSKFYIIEEGTAVATKNGAQVMTYGPGDYFGELALIRNQPRAATVICQSQVKALSIDGGSFKRLLNVNALLERSRNYC